tara:strand:- start:242 stop:406 length:165 start_codon:yes stop_codon:yes gene_type:complete
MIFINGVPICSTFNHYEADNFLRNAVYVSIAKNIDLTDEDGNLIHSITTNNSED